MREGSECGPLDFGDSLVGLHMEAATPHAADLWEFVGLQFLSGWPQPLFLFLPTSSLIWLPIFIHLPIYRLP